MDIYFIITLVLIIFINTNYLILAYTNDIPVTFEKIETHETKRQSSLKIKVIRGQIDYYFTNKNNEITIYFNDDNI